MTDWAEPAPASLEKVERLGCLYLTFLNYPGGLSFQQIRDFLPLAYPGDRDISRRKFERDKEELKRLGLVLRHFAPGSVLPSGREAGEHTYVPAEEIQKLPELRLEPDEASELAAVLFAAIDEFEERDEAFVENLQSAAVKLLYRHPSPPSGGVGARPEGLPASDGDEVSGSLGVVMDALHRRRLLVIDYPSRGGTPRSRRVEGRGLLTHRGRWCLVAHCREVDAIRSFYLDRIQRIEVTETNYAHDPNFRIKDYSLHPLGIRIHEPEALRLTIDAEREEVFRDFLIGLPAFLNNAPDPEGDSDEATGWRIETTNRGALFSWMIRNPGVVLGLGPESALSAFREYRAALAGPYDFALETRAGSSA